MCGAAGSPAGTDCFVSPAPPPSVTSRGPGWPAAGHWLTSRRSLASPQHAQWALLIHKKLWYTFGRIMFFEVKEWSGPGLSLREYINCLQSRKRSIWNSTYFIYFVSDVTCNNSKEKYQDWLLFCLTKVLDSLGLRRVCKKLLFPSSPAALYSYPGPADLGLRSGVLPARPRLGRDFFCCL